MRMRDTVRYRNLVLLQKHATWVYALLYFAGMGLFFKLRLYRLEYIPKDSYLSKHKIAQYGLTRLHGNLASIRDWWVIALLLLGVIMGLAIFFYSARQLHQPGWPALIVGLGALLPLLGPYNENVLTRIAISAGLILFGTVLQWSLNKILMLGPSPYRSDKPLLPSAK